jgi:hypothetical protein
LFSLSQNGSERNSEPCFWFCSMVQNSEHFSLLRNRSERTENFLFRGTAGILPEQTNCSVYSVFRRIIFFSEIANPTLQCRQVQEQYRLCTVCDTTGFTKPAPNYKHWTMNEFNIQIDKI